MVLQLFGSSNKPLTVAELVSRKKYTEAIDLLKKQIRERPSETGLRLQAADIMILAGRADNAVCVLEGVADELATAGFVAKAIAVLKKIQKLQPSRRDIEKKLVGLIHTSADESKTAKRKHFKDMGPEDIEPNMRADAAARSAPQTPPPTSFQAPSFIEESYVHQSPENLNAGDLSSAAAELERAVASSPAMIHVREEEEAFAPPAPPVEPEKRVLSPLFDDFSEAELLEVVRGLELLTYEAGDIVVTEGQPGDSLFVVTTGIVKAFVRNKDGGSTQVRQLNEGDFFGEISILTGKPRSATITAGSACELLELDRATLDSITQHRPRVREVLQRFYDERTNNAAEIQARGIEVVSSKTAREAGLVEGSEPPVEVHVEVVEDTDPVGNLRRLAIEHSRKSNWADAVLAWKQYLGLNPADIDAMNVLGVLYGKLGRWQEAAETFEQLVATSSKDATVHFNLAVAYRQLDALPQAAAAYKHALALKPDYDKARQGLSATVAKMKAR